MNQAQFKIGGKTYNFSALTLRKFYSLKTILETEDKEKEFKIVSCITECPIKELKRLTYVDWLVIWEETEHQLTHLQGDTSDIVPIVELAGVKYGLPAIEDITVGEFADLDIILSGGNPDSKMAEIAAVLYRPIVKMVGDKLKLQPYDSDGFTQRAQTFLDFPLTAIKSANAFFLQSTDRLLKNIKDSLMSLPEMKTLSPQYLESLNALPLLGDGGAQSIFLLGKTLSDLKTQQNFRLGLHSTFSVGRKTRLKNRIWPFKKQLH